MIAELVLSIVSEGLRFINEHEANAIREKILNLREAFRAELSKGSLRDDALLDFCEYQLRDICELYLATLKQTPPSSQ